MPPELETFVSDSRRELYRSAMRVREAAHPLTGSPSDYDPLISRLNDASIVLLGESTHGTKEFYAERMRITQRLIEERGFNAVAIEGDWPDAHRVNRFIRGADDFAETQEALGGFRRFPAWMWRNQESAELVSFLRHHNAMQGSERDQVGFYGLDLYGLFSAIEAVIRYLDEADPESAVMARDRYSCFGAFTDDPQSYGHAVTLGVSEPCRRAAVAQLVDLRRMAFELPRDGFAYADERFLAEENARCITAAEEYYRSMFSDPRGSWNLRDRHMADTLDHLVAHLERYAGKAKVVVWAHNSHVGDARATEVSQRGELTLGQLARERYGHHTVLVGMTTYEGTVTAARDWGQPPEVRNVRPAHAGSIEELLHHVGLDSLLLTPAEGTRAYQDLNQPFGERAIGVVYRPETEQQSHYLTANPARQFDAIVHIDRTTAVTPLDPIGSLADREPPETYPTAL